MTIFRSCTGCMHQKQPCATRDALRDGLRGLSITSVKWRCADRNPRFVQGDPVWVTTVATYNATEEEGGPCRTEFPGVMITPMGTKGLVCIAPGTEDIDGEYTFDAARGNGFCKIPLSRLRPRDGERDPVCPECLYPASMGHILGNACNPHPVERMS